MQPAIPYHIHNGSDSPRIQAQDIESLPDPFSLAVNYFPIALNGGGTTVGGSVTHQQGNVTLDSGAAPGNYAHNYYNPSMTVSHARTLKVRFFLDVADFQNNSTFYIWTFSEAVSSPTKYVRLRGQGTGSMSGNIYFETSDGTSSTSRNITSLFGTLSAGVLKEVMIEIDVNQAAKLYVDRQLIHTISTTLPSLTYATALQLRTQSSGTTSTKIRVYSPHALTAY